MACFVRSFPLHCEGALFYIKNVCKFLCFCCCVFQNEFYNLIWFQNENLKQSDSSRSCGIPNVLWDCFSAWMLCCICCTGKASPHCASLCGSANYQIERKHNCTGYIWMVFLLCEFPSHELSTDRFEWMKTRTLCICEAFPQSGSFCAASDRLK